MKSHLGFKITSKQRLQVFLSHSGVCSRREAMRIIFTGRVRVNGKVIQEPSYPVDPRKDKINVDGLPVLEKRFTYILLNKPRGVTTTKKDRFAERTVFDLLPAQYRHLFPVGRLDKDTEGLLLLTNDGEAAYQLTHPKFNIDKTYLVRINGRLQPQARENLEKGVNLEGQLTAPAEVSCMKDINGQTEFLMTIHEGRKRQIRLMLHTIGHRVVYLKRLVQGPLQLGTLPTGKWRLLNNSEITLLRKLK